MKEYLKAVLYAYPLLKTVGKDYEEHIRNKALLSYESPMTTERLTEYIAGEIVCKEELEWLKAKIDGVLERLSDVERTLLGIRYFGKRKKIRDFLPKKGAKGTGVRGWTKYTYFHRQKRLEEKVAAMLTAAGMSERTYRERFAEIDIFRKIESLMRKREEAVVCGSGKRRARYSSES